MLDYRFPSRYFIMALSDSLLVSTDLHIERYRPPVSSTDLCSLGFEWTKIRLIARTVYPHTNRGNGQISRLFGWLNHEALTVGSNSVAWHNTKIKLETLFIDRELNPEISPRCEHDIIDRYAIYELFLRNCLYPGAKKISLSLRWCNVRVEEEWKDWTSDRARNCRRCSPSGTITGLLSSLAQGFFDTSRFKIYCGWQSL